MDSCLEFRNDDPSVPDAVRELAEVGSVSLPGPFPTPRLAELSDAYDQAMAAACGPDFNVGSTTTRMSGMLSFSPIFDEIFLHQTLLDLCHHFIREDFKLSSFLGRTLRAGAPAQPLHADLPRASQDAPLLGFILLVDPFTEQNGATRFVPGSHRWPGLPAHSMADLHASYPGERLGCGPAGAMLVFDAAIWHGHTANRTTHDRRSIQGYFVHRSAAQGFDFASRLSDRVKARMTPPARHLLALDQQQEGTRPALGSRGRKAISS